MKSKTKGREIYEGEVGTLYKATFGHAYFSNNFIGPKVYNRKNHACLEMGYWCWKNALTNPIKALKFLVKPSKE